MLVLCSNTSLTARSRSSGGYLPGRVMAPTSHESEPPGIPGRFTEKVQLEYQRPALSAATYGHHGKFRGCRQSQENVPLACPPCHSRAISEGQSRYRADNHGHSLGTHDLAA